MLLAYPEWLNQRHRNHVPTDRRLRRRARGLATRLTGLALGTGPDLRAQPGVEINGVWVVALPQGFQDLMPGSNSSHHIGVLLTAIDQPAFPDWIKLKRAVFTQGEIAGLTEGEVQKELLLGENQEACRPVRPYGIEKNEKLLCADPQQVRFISTFSIIMHLIFEAKDNPSRSWMSSVRPRPCESCLRPFLQLFHCR